MSVLEDLQQLERRIIDRAAELRGAVEEFDQLRQAASRLGIDLDAAPSPARRRTARRTTRTSAGTRPAPGTSRRRGSRRDDVLRLVEQRPGITVAELGRALKVSPTGLYRVVRELESDGAVRKDGRALVPSKS